MTVISFCLDCGALFSISEFQVPQRPDLPCREVDVTNTHVYAWQKMPNEKKKVIEKETQKEKRM